MGMSGDFEVAVEEGATMVRVGTALFGTRAGAVSGEGEGTGCSWSGTCSARWRGCSTVLIGLQFVILINALLSWVRPDPFNPIVAHARARLRDLVCDPIRRLLPMQSLGIDLSPLLAILLLQFIDLVLVGSLRELAARLSRLSGARCARGSTVRVQSRARSRSAWPGGWPTGG